MDAVSCGKNSPPARRYEDGSPGLSLVGEVRLTAEQYGLVFAAEGKLPKLVAWSENDRRLPFASGNLLCLQRSPTPGPSAKPQIWYSISSLLIRQPALCLPS